MTSDRYMSWTLCGDSKLTQQMPLPLTPIATSFGMQPISMISIKSRKDLRERHSLNKKKSVMMMNMPMQKSNFPLIQNQRNILHIQIISHHFTPRCHKSLSSLPTSSHQYDLHQVKKGPQRKAFSQQEEISDDDEYANAEEQFSTDPDPEEHSPYSVYQSSFHPKMPQKSFLPPNIWETLSESTKQMIIEHNKKVKLNNPTPYPSGSKTKPNPTLGKPTPAPQQVHQHSQDEPTEEPPPDTSTQTLVNKCLAESGIDPTDIQNVMSVSYAKRNISSHESSRQIQTHQRYVFARVNQSNHHLIDSGANGGLAGADMRVIHTTPRKINIVGIDDHELTGLNVVTAAALLDTQKGPIIGVFHEYAHLGKGRSIHAAGQMEWFNCQVDDRSKVVGGAQRIKTSEGYVIPLSIESGLVYMHSMRIPTDHDLQNYPHVFFTSPDIWDTSVLDHGIPQSLLEDIDQHSDASLLQDSIFDAYGEPHHRDMKTLNSSFCDLPSLPPGEPITHAHIDRIPSTTPGAEPPRDARDSGAARSHSTHLETSSSDRPKMVTYTEPQTVPSYMSVTCTRRTLRMPNFTRAMHAQPSLSNFPWRDSDFGEWTRSCGTTLGERNFPTSPQNRITKFIHCSIYTSIRTISSPHTK